MKHVQHPRSCANHGACIHHVAVVGSRVAPKDMPKSESLEMNCECDLFRKKSLHM